MANQDLNNLERLAKLMAMQDGWKRFSVLAVWFAREDWADYLAFVRQAAPQGNPLWDGLEQMLQVIWRFDDENSTTPQNQDAFGEMFKDKGWQVSDKE